MVNLVELSEGQAILEQKAIVLFSGGQDSATCLAWALARFETVETLAFAYGQRHRVELDCRLRVIEELKNKFPDWGARLSKDHLLDLSVLGSISKTALTRDMEIRTPDGGLPTTFVPGRNIIFLTFAAALAYQSGIRHLVAGMCETDYSGYPDCRDDSIKAMQVALGLGMGRGFVIHTPLMWRDKQATWALAHQLGGDTLVELIREHTHSCYQGKRDQRHIWGYGCGTCPACVLRAKGYTAWVNAK